MLNTDLLKIEHLNKYSVEELEDYEAEIRLHLLVHPKSIAKIEKLASLCLFKKEYEQAIYFFKKLISLNKKNPNWYGFLGYVYYEQEEYEKAIAAFECVIEMIPQSPFVCFLLGNSHSCLGNIREAAWFYELAIFLDFDIYGAHLDFAKKYETMGKRQKALEEYILAYEIDPRDSKIKKKIETLSK